LPIVAQNSCQRTTKNDGPRFHQPKPISSGYKLRALDKSFAERGCIAATSHSTLEPLLV
jgi:hypothetical protein